MVLWLDIDSELYKVWLQPQNDRCFSELITGGSVRNSLPGSCWFLGSKDQNPRPEFSPHLQDVAGASEELGGPAAPKTWANQT